MDDDDDALSCKPMSNVMNTLQRTYGLSDADANRVFNLGDDTNQRANIGGHEFRSGHRSSAFDDQYYIPVYGPRGELITTCYHYDG